MPSGIFSWHSPDILEEVTSLSMNDIGTFFVSLLASDLDFLPLASTGFELSVTEKPHRFLAAGVHVGPLSMAHGVTTTFDL